MFLKFELYRRKNLTFLKGPYFTLRKFNKSLILRAGGVIFFISWGEV